jgi:plastocyanin
VEGLPSARSAAGETIGPSALAEIDGRLMLLSAGGGAAHGNPDAAAGVYDITDGTPVLIADLGAWVRANPVASPPEGDLDPDGVFYDMVADPAGGAVLVSESNGEQILRIGLDGSVSRVVDLSAENLVPTALASGPDGSLYVGHFTSAPFTSGSATVIRVLADGVTETVWTGLTMVTGLAVGPDGELYAAQLSQGRESPPFFEPGTGRIVRQTGLDSGEEVATQLNFPTAIEFGPDGALHVALPAVGADSGSGQILRVDLSAELPLRGEDFDLAPPACLASTAEVLVKVSDLGFDPSTITVQVGATVTWRNTGELDHAVASEEQSAITWDSGVLRPGDEYAVTFDEPGTYPYFNGLYPERTATINVVAAESDGGGP